MCYIFCFFKQKTAYEMRISDWSSDVCSSDLFPVLVRGRHENDYMPEYRNQSHECNVRGAGNPRAANVFSPQIRKPRRPAPPWLPPQPENPWPASSSTSCARSTPTAPSASPTPVSTWRRSEEHTSELQSLMRISYAVFCLKKKT